VSRTRTRSALATMIVATVVVAACSGDDDSADEATTVPTTEASSTSVPPTTVAETASSTTPSSSTPDTTTPDTTAPAEDVDPFSQTLEWTDCDGIDCAMAIVPIDYDDPSAGTTTISMVRLPAQGDKIGTLFINPGGPGGSGIDFALGQAQLFGEGILESFDIVGFDPRGVGQSDPLICADTAGLDEWLGSDVDADDPESVAAYQDIVEGIGNGCLDTNPELSQHVTTVETAKDIDLLRTLVGDDQLYYYGGSYGSFLGATYAALFPENVGRMVLDGPPDPLLHELQNRLRQAGGFQLAFDDYAADCVETGCPLGDSVDEVEQTVADLFEAALADPLPTDDPERPLTRALAVQGMAAPLYDEEAWSLLTESLDAAVNGGDWSAILRLADINSQRSEDGYPNNISQAQTAINCLDEQLLPEADSEPTEDDFIAASSLFGSYIYGIYAFDCDAWPIEPSVTFPDYAAAGAAPILVVGTTGDPATPIENAYALADELDSGVLLVREGEGHTAYFAFNPCINEIVDAYLVDGTVPDEETTCSESGELVGADADTTATTEPDTDETDGTDGTDDGESALGSEASGTATMTVAGDVVFEGDVAQCTIADPDLQVLVQGETAEMAIGVDDDGSVFVVVTGAYEFVGEGSATFDGAGLDQGNVTVSGTGAQPDDSAPVADFVVDLEVASC